jgi:hypothetical protein
MADITVDRLVVFIEAQTRSFESQIKRLEGQVNTSTRRMASSFGALNKQMAASGSVLGRVFGIPGIGRGGAVGAIAATVYGVNRLANSMGDLRKAARDAGISIDEATLQSAEKFNDAWDESFQRLSVNFRKYLAGGFPGGFGQFFKETAGNFRGAPHTMTGTKADLLPQSHDFTAWDEADRVIEDLTKSFEKLRDASNEAAQGMTDSVQDFTHAIMDNPKDWAGALTNMLKGVSTDIVDAGLFGSGPYAKLLGTAGPGSGGPGGLIGDAFGSLLGNRSFGNGNTPVPVTIVGMDNTVGTQLIPSLLAGKDQSRLMGSGATPYGVLNAVAPTRRDCSRRGSSEHRQSLPGHDCQRGGHCEPAGRRLQHVTGFGKFLPGGKEQDLTGMTLDQILKLQDSMRTAPGNAWGPRGLPSTALGRYQITETKLKELMAQQNLPGTTLFDQSTQDKLALLDAQGRGPNAAGLMSEWQGLTKQSPEFMSKLVANFPGAGTAPVPPTVASAVPPSALDWLLHLIPGFAAGGPVAGRGTKHSDSVPAMLSTGEFVVNADAADKWGHLLERINKNKPVHLAAGGPGGRINKNKAGGHSYAVGPRVPEMIVPRAPGTVIPHGGSMGGRDVQIFDQRTNAPAIRQQRGPNGNMQLFIRDAMDASIKAGNHDKAMQSRYGAKPAQVGRT